MIETMKTSAYSPQYEKLRAWLKAQRQAQNLSLRDVAAKIDRHHSIVGKMEQNRRKIEIVEFVQYCNALGIDPHEGLEIIITSLASD